MKLIKVVKDKDNNTEIFEEIKVDKSLFGPFYKIHGDNYYSDMCKAIFTQLALEELESANNYVISCNNNVEQLRDDIIETIGQKESTAAIVLACTDIILICAEATSEIYYKKEFSDPIFIMETYFKALGRYGEVESIRRRIAKKCGRYNHGIVCLAVIEVLISCFIRIIELTRNNEYNK